MLRVLSTPLRPKLAEQIWFGFPFYNGKKISGEKGNLVCIAVMNDRADCLSARFSYQISRRNNLSTIRWQNKNIIIIFSPSYAPVPELSVFTLLISFKPHKNRRRLFQFTEEENEAQRDSAIFPAQPQSQQEVEARLEPRQPDLGAYTLISSVIHREVHCFLPLSACSGLTLPLWAVIVKGNCLEKLSECYSVMWVKQARITFFFN